MIIKLFYKEREKQIWIVIDSLSKNRNKFCLIQQKNVQRIKIVMIWKCFKYCKNYGRYKS